MAKSNSKILAMNEANAAVLVELITGPNISESLRIQAMEKLTGDREGQSFFLTMMEEQLSHGACPRCGHMNHWLIPEDALNEMGYVSHDKDKRVPERTDETNCSRYQQACLKKKVTT